jgi:hypothetical protein
MSAKGTYVTAFKAGLRMRGVALCAALLTLGLGAFAVAPAAANSLKGHKYTLSVVEGESTLPEEQLAHVSATSSVHGAAVVISIVRSGTVVARSTGTESSWMSTVPLVGDDVTLESPANTLIGSVVYDGLPSIDPTVCAGSVNFSGANTAGYPVEGGFYSFTLHTDPYGNTNEAKTGFGQAQVSSLSGSSYGGSFLTPLAIGQTVWAKESFETLLPAEATFTYSSETERPVGGCPAPPPPPPPPPAPPALQGTVLKLSSSSIRKLLKFGLTDRVTINQPGTVVQDLYLEGGTLPAHASSARRGKHRRHGRKRPALLLARGSAAATVAGTVKVPLQLTAKGRRVLRHAHHVRAVLITTLHSSSGAKLNLPRRSVSFGR